jgi:hypothetical protein
MTSPESSMRSFSYNSRYFLELFGKNIRELELPANAAIQHLSISRKRVKRFTASRRQGLKLTLSSRVQDRHHEKKFWFKQVDYPKELYDTMKFIYSTLQRKGIHGPVPKPLFFDGNVGGILMTFKEGVNLFPLTFAFCCPFTTRLVSQLPEYYQKIGVWLQRYHNTFATGRLVSTRSILEELYDSLSNYTSIKDSERHILISQIRSFLSDPIATTTFESVRTHNDVTLRNILIKPNREFVLMDWDNMVNPGFPRESWCWSDLGCLINNIQSLLRFYPLVSEHKLGLLCKSLLHGYFNENKSLSEITIEDFLDKVFYIQTLMSFLGIKTDRPLFQIHTARLTWRFVAMIRKSLLNGKAYML